MHCNLAAKANRKLATLKAKVDADSAGLIGPVDEEPANARLQLMLEQERLRKEKLAEKRSERNQHKVALEEEGSKEEEEEVKTKKQLAKEAKRLERERQKQEASELHEWEHGVEEEVKKKKKGKNAKKLPTQTAEE